MAWRPPPSPRLASARASCWVGEQHDRYTACGGKKQTTADTTDGDGTWHAALRDKELRSSLAQSPPPASEIQPRPFAGTGHAGICCWDERTADRVITSTTHKQPLHPRPACVIPRGMPCASRLDRSCVTCSLVVVFARTMKCLRHPPQNVHPPLAEARQNVAQTCQRLPIPRLRLAPPVLDTLPLLPYLICLALLLFPSRRICVTRVLLATTPET